MTRQQTSNELQMKRESRGSAKGTVMSDRFQASIVVQLLLLLFATWWILLVGSPAWSQCSALNARYYGHWFNDTFQSTGPAVFAIDVQGAVANFDVDMDGSVFGNANPAAVQFAGSVVGNTITVNAPALTTFGNLSGSIDCLTGNLAFTISMIPVVSFDDVTVTGDIENQAFDVDYQIDAMGLFFASGRMEATVPGTPASDFEAGDELWRDLSNGARSSGQVPIGGNPGGFFVVEELSNFESFVATAPGTFLGDLSAFDGGTLRFDANAIQDGGAPSNPAFGTVVITGENASASLDFDGAGLPPANTWVTHEMPFTAAAWGVSQGTWDSILAEVRSLTIELDSNTVNGEGGLDNVVLLPEPGTVASLAAALAALALTRIARRRAQ